MGRLLTALGKLIGRLVKLKLKKQVPKPPSQFPKQQPSSKTACPVGCKPATKEEILQDAKLLKISSSSQYSKQGGFTQANKDFDAMTRGGSITNRGNGLRTAEMADGTKIIVRPFSSGGTPTLEIQPVTGKTIKIRYE